MKSSKDASGLEDADSVDGSVQPDGADRSTVDAPLQAEQARKRTDESYRLMVENVREYAIFTLDPDARIATWNGGAERVFGFGEREALGQDLRLVLSPQDVSAGAVELDLAAATKMGEAPLERWYVRKDGCQVWCTGVLTALYEGDGKLRGFVEILRDRTERKLFEERLQQLQQVAEAASASRDQFLASVSHELRTPLSVILMWSTLINKGSVGAAQMPEAMGAIERSAREQKGLIDDLLDAARLAAGKVHLDVRAVGLSDVLRRALDSLRPAATAKHLALMERTTPAVGVAEVDPERFRQIVWNLVSNAVKFTPQDGRVDVTLDRRGDTIELRVQDTGKGIAPGFLPHLFERYRQAETDEFVESGGFGLGLSIVRQLVELHGGSVHAESPGLDRGATFVVRIPAVRAPSAAGAAAAGSEGVARA